MQKLRELEREKGITLVALVVTIVILIILATISVNILMREGLVGIMQKGKGLHESAATNEEQVMQEVIDYADTALGNIPTGPNGKQLVTSITTTKHNTITAEDNIGNKVAVPNGFKIAKDSGSSVKEGIVVEDDIGNQFVWIPVSNINHDGSNKIKIDDKDEEGTEITLGRYTFATTTPGTEKVIQYANTYTTTSKVQQSFQELSTPQESTSTSTNTTAKDLKGFVESVEKNHGYYIARYEASYASGSEFGVGDDSSYYKPASKKTIANTTKSMSYVAGTLWNSIAQPEAAKVGRQMYYGNKFIESDLVNSYMWDTAILYIQVMENANYANESDGNGTLKNTGETGDEKCHIFDMSGNLKEWTTEKYISVSPHQVFRGSSYLSSDYRTAYRSTTSAGATGRATGFRVGLWLKNSIS